MAVQATTIKLANDERGLRRATPEDLLARADQAFQAIARRAFELFEGNGRGFGHDAEDWFNAESELLHPTHLTLAESDGSFTVQAEVPGFSAKDLEVSVEPQRLTIAGKRETSKEEKDKKILYTERCANQILRVMDLPTEVDTGKVEATLKEGLLELTLPKKAQSKKSKAKKKA
jgi:HSP20 family protein